MKKFRNIIIAVILVSLIGFVGYYFWNQSVAAAQGQYQTTPATRGSLAATVGATGTVRANQTALLTWQTTGTVESVRVKVGDVVKKDTLLAELASDSLSQNIIMAYTDLLTAQRNLEDLKTSNTARAQAELAVAQAEKALDDAKTRYDGINFARASDTKIDNVQAELDLLNNQISQARSFYNRVSNLPDGDSRKASALSNLTSLELRRNQVVAELNYITGRPDDNEISQRLSNYEIAKAQLDDAKRQLERLQNGPDPLDIARLEAQVTAAQATLNLARITAPFDGTLTLADPLPGDQVAPGTQAFRLDDLSRLLVDVQISEVDINTIAAGQPVTMSFDAILGKTYNGLIVDVGQVGNVVQGAVNFTVTVELTDGDPTVRPGMTAAVNILVKEVKDVLLVPNRAVRIVDGQRVVYVLVDGFPVMTKIRLGSSSDTVSEVVGGDLKEGDLVILNPPAVFGPMGGPPGGGN
jgi:HlyD family secretion protein